MIKINFSPVRSDEQTTVALSGLVLTVNNEAFDLSEIPDGATVQHEVIQNCTRNGDDFELTLTLTHGANAPHKTRFPESVEITGSEWELEYVFDELTEAIIDAIYDENGDKRSEDEALVKLAEVANDLVE